MTTNTYKSNFFPSSMAEFSIHRGMVFGVIIITALLAFELFNYGTTDYALTDLLGNLTFLGIRWATILAIAFCGIDFAGIGRLFTPEENTSFPHHETWYLFGAWLLAATMNAMLTWWGVSLAILHHQTLSSAVVDRGTILRVTPIFIAVLVWLIRILIIGTFTSAGDAFFEQTDIYSHPTGKTNWSNTSPLSPGRNPTRLQKPAMSMSARTLGAEPRKMS